MEITTENYQWELRKLPMEITHVNYSWKLPMEITEGNGELGVDVDVLSHLHQQPDELRHQIHKRQLHIGHAVRQSRVLGEELRRLTQHRAQLKLAVRDGAEFQLEVATSLDDARLQLDHRFFLRAREATVMRYK